MGRWFSVPILLAFSAAVAFAVSAWMLLKSLSGAGIPGCGEGSGCDAVLSSRWSRWGRIPVALPGAALYLLILVAAVWLAPLGPVPAATAMRRLLWGASLLAGGAAIWFILLQAAVIRRFCPFCMLAHAMGLTACVLAIWHARMQDGGVVDLLGTLGAAGMLIALVIGQLILEPRLYVIDRAEPTAVPMASHEQFAAAASPPGTGDGERLSHRQAGRQIQLLGGQITLRMDDWPLVGSPDAPHVMAALLDFTCPTCRGVHRMLEEARRQFGPSLAILVLPVPQDPTCNPHLVKRDFRHAEACTFARLAMIVWQEKPAAYTEFESWLFSHDEPPPLGIAIVKAKALLGSDGIDPRIPDPAIQSHFAEAIRIFRSVGTQKIPTILLPGGTLVADVLEHLEGGRDDRAGLITAPTRWAAVTAR